MRRCAEMACPALPPHIQHCTCKLVSEVDRLVSELHTYTLAWLRLANLVSGPHTPDHTQHLEGYPILR